MFGQISDLRACAGVGSVTLVELSVFVTFVWLLVVAGLWAAGRPVSLAWTWCITYLACGSLLVIIAVSNRMCLRLRRTKPGRRRWHDSE
jgi:hypothetical protein